MASLDNDARSGITELSNAKRKEPDGQFKDGLVYITASQAAKKWPDVKSTSWRYAFTEGKIEDLVRHRGKLYAEITKAEAFAQSKVKK